MCKAKHRDYYRTHDELVETTSAQEANAIKYRSPAFHGLSLGLLYGLGGVAGNFSNGRIAGAYVNEHNRALGAMLSDVYSLLKATQVYLHVVAQQATGVTGARAAIFALEASGTPRQVVFVAGVHHLF